jgi:acyl dehydratase
MKYADIKAGQVIDCGRRKVTEEEILEFARKYDPQPFHTDRAFAAASQWGGLIGSGWMSCSIAMELVVKAILKDSDSIGSPGIDEIRWEGPVRPDDEVAVQVHVLESRISSNGKYGVVRWRWEMRNQRDERVMHLTGISLFKVEAAT